MPKRRIFLGIQKQIRQKYIEFLVCTGPQIYRCAVRMVLVFVGVEQTFSGVAKFWHIRGKFRVYVGKNTRGARKI